MDLPAEAKSNIAGYRAFPFTTFRVAMFGVPPFGFITPFAPLIPQRPPLAVAPTSANAFFPNTFSENKKISPLK